MPFAPSQLITPSEQPRSYPAKSQGREGGNRRRVIALDPLHGADWDEALAAFPEATVFHSGAWARVLARTYAHRPHYLALQRGESLEALLPLMEVRSTVTGCRGVCLPFSDLCGPLLRSDTDLAPLYDHVASLAVDRGWKYAEIRGGSSREGDREESATYYAHELDLSGGWDDVQVGFASSLRRALRKAQRAGLTARTDTSWQAVERFCGLHELTRRRHGAPPQPLSFFRHLHEELLATGQGFLVLVEDGDTAVAAALFLHRGGQAIYKFGASDVRSWQNRPNNLALAKGIEVLSGRGCHSLHFGRTDRHQDGLRRFKTSFGALEKPLFYHKFEPGARQWVPISTERRTKGAARLVFSRLPLIANRCVGRILYPHLD